MRKRKPNAAGAGARKRRPYLGLIVAGTVVFFSLFFLCGYIGLALRNLSYFRVKDIIVRETNASEGSAVPSGSPDRIKKDLSYLRGENIFNLDLRKQSSYISEMYPAYKNVRLVRLLPDRLFVDFITRRPVAYVKLYRYFCVGQDLVLFDMPAQTENPDLPVIWGLETRIFGPRSGRKYEVRELALALDIIREVGLNNVLKDYQIKKIDAASSESVSFLLVPPVVQQKEGTFPPASGPGILEVKISQDNLKDKIKILGGLLGQLRDTRDKIKYVDLRFKEPVIKLKDAK